MRSEIKEREGGRGNSSANERENYCGYDKREK